MGYRGFAVAVAAGEDLVAAWGANLAPPPVVLASDPQFEIKSISEEERKITKRMIKILKKSREVNP